MELAIRESTDDRTLEGLGKALRKEGCRISMVKSIRKHISREGVEEEAERRGIFFFFLQTPFMELNQYLRKKLGKQKQANSKQKARQANMVTIGGGWGEFYSF